MWVCLETITNHGCADTTQEALQQRCTEAEDLLGRTGAGGGGLETDLIRKQESRMYDPYSS